MLLEKTKNLDYSEFLESIKKYLMMRTVNLHDKERNINCIKLLDNYNEQQTKYFTKAFSGLDKEISSYYRAQSSFKLYEPLCCMIELIGLYYDKIQEFNTKEITTLSFCVWNLYEESIIKNNKIIFDKNIISEIRKKFPTDMEKQSTVFDIVMEECSLTEEKDITNIINNISEEEIETFDKKHEKELADVFYSCI